MGRLGDRVSGLRRGEVLFLEQKKKNNHTPLTSHLPPGHLDLMEQMMATMTDMKC